MPRKFSQTVVNTKVREQRRVFFAAGTALGLHLFLLLLSPLSSDLLELSRETQRAISIQLSQPVKPDRIEAVTPIPVIGPEKTPEAAPEVVQESVIQEAEKKREINEPLTTAALQNWSRLETDRLLRTDPEAATDFAATFIAPKVIKKPAQSSFKSGYGETHVVSKVGDKQVCYMQSQEHPQDDWSKGLVMFYDCAPEDKFTLEVP